MLEWEPPDDNGGVELIGNVRTLGMFAKKMFANTMFKGIKLRKKIQNPINGTSYMIVYDIVIVPLATLLWETNIIFV